MNDQLSPESEPSLSHDEVKAASRARREGGFPIKDLPALVGLRDSLTAAIHDKADVNQPERFFLGNDHSGHTYVVPVSRREQWTIFTTIPEDDEASWKVPKWATRIDGTHTLTFADWSVDLSCPS